MIMRQRDDRGIRSPLHFFVSGDLDIERLVDTRRQPRGRVCLKWKPLGVNLLATARTSLLYVSSAIFWASITSPIGRPPIGMKHMRRLLQRYLRTMLHGAAQGFACEDCKSVVYRWSAGYDYAGWQRHEKVRPTSRRSG
jgi:hypothetical protein